MGPFFSNGGNWLRQAAGGWSVQGIYQFQMRGRLSFDTTNPLFIGDIKDIPLPSSKRSVDQWFNVNGFERSGARQLADSVRTFPSRLAAVRAPGWNNFDLSVSKNFRIRERLGFNFARKLRMR